jgi:hypothetical protein
MIKRSTNSVVSEPPAPFAANTGVTAKFRDVDRLTSSAGICSVISQRRDGLITFAVFKMFHKLDDRGRPAEEKTSFFPASMAEAYIEHIRLTMERIEQIMETEPEVLPFGLPRPESR